MEKYYYWKESTNIEVIPSGGIFLYVDRFDGRFKHYAIDEIALEIIRSFDGTKTMEEIYHYFCDKYNETIENVKNIVNTFVFELNDNYQLHLGYHEEPVKHEVEVKHVNYYPKVVSLELTDFCNLECKHCYGAFGNDSHCFMPLEKAKKLLKELDEVRTVIIELTGGECLTHPNFKEILLYAISLNFKMITILSNGVAFTPELFEIIKENKKRVSVQIDMHSLDEDYLYWFTGRKNILNTIEKNVKSVIATGAPVRVVSVITKLNLKELDDIAKWAYENNVQSYSISPVIELGRACKYDKDLLLDEKEYQGLMLNIQEIADRYPEMMQRPFVEQPDPNNANCGCVSSHLTVHCDGEIKLCTMDCEGCTKDLFGNVTEQGLKKVFDDKQELIAAIATQQVPKKDDIHCMECENYTFCVNCMLRTMIKAMSKKDECHWYQHCLSPMFKEAFFG